MRAVRKCEGRDRLHATSWKALETGQWHYIPDLHTSQSSLHPRRGQKSGCPLLVFREGQKRVFRRNSLNRRENSGFVCVTWSWQPLLTVSRSFFAGTFSLICKKKKRSFRSDPTCILRVVLYLFFFSVLFLSGSLEPHRWRRVVRQGSSPLGDSLSSLALAMGSDKSDFGNDQLLGGMIRGSVVPVLALACGSRNH